MKKQIAMVALAAFATAAMADDNMWRDPSNNSWESNERWVQMHADRIIPGADAYTLSNIFDRAPSNVSVALANSLARTTWHAKIMGDEIAWSRMPEKVTYITTTTNADGTMMTMTTSTEWVAQARPMRMVMERYNPRMISYEEAAEIVNSNLSDSEATAFRTWYWGSSTDGQKDAIVAYLEANAKYADRIVYRSTIPRSWTR